MSRFEWLAEDDVTWAESLVVKKGGPGSGHRGHAGIPGQRGGSLPGTGSNYLPPEQRVWQGKQQEGKLSFNQNETGRRGEILAAKALQDKFGVEFALMNDGLNNAAVDVAGDHHAVEVKTGPATNGYSAQQWRITTSYTSGPTERALISKMSPQERSQYNRYKQQQSIERKNATVAQMSEIAGAQIKPATVGVILSADGTRGDVYMVPDFHLRLGWNKYAIEEYYLGTYEVGDVMKEDVFKGGPGSGHHGHAGRPGKRGGSVAGGALEYALKLSNVEMQQIERYTDSGYIIINKSLREAEGDIPTNKNVATAVATLDSIVKDAPPLEHDTLYRMMRGDVYDNGVDLWDMQDYGFVSTTHSENALKTIMDNMENPPDSFTVFKIDTSSMQGRRGVGVYLENVSTQPQEYEVLLRRGSVFSVTDMYQRGNVWYVDAELIDE